MIEFLGNQPPNLELEMFRKSLLALSVAAIFACNVAPVSGGLFCKKDCCDPCCAPAPVCAPAPPVCAPAPVCCPPPAPKKINKTLSLCDPCGCMQSVDVCIPACCANEEPCVTCRKGLFGRKIYTATWKCCGHSAKIVMTKHGKTRVR